MEELEKKNLQMNEEIKKLSGERKSDIKFIEFLYLLMRDEIVPGKIGAILREITFTGETVEYSNGFLFDYCEYVYNKLKD